MARFQKNNILDVESWMSSSLSLPPLHFDMHPTLLWLVSELFWRESDGNTSYRIVRDWLTLSLLIPFWWVQFRFNWSFIFLSVSDGDTLHRTNEGITSKYHKLRFKLIRRDWSVWSWHKIVLFQVSWKDFDPHNRQRHHPRFMMLRCHEKNEMENFKLKSYDGVYPHSYLSP